MLPKSRRLKTEDFKNLRNAWVVHTPHLVLRLFPIPPEKSLSAGISLPAQAGQVGRAAVIVPASSYKRAVDRNLLRRRMYHVIEAHHSLLQGCTLTLTLKKGALKASFHGLETEFLEALKK